MNNLKKALELLKSREFTCVLCRGDEIITSTRRGVAPMLEYIEMGIDLKSFCAADKVIGKAAAMLFHLVGITELYGEIMSKPAAEYLSKTNIVFSYGTLTEKIINRNGDGLCPMETAVLDINDPKKGLTAIKNKYNELRKAD